MMTCLVCMQQSNRNYSLTSNKTHTLTLQFLKHCSCVLCNLLVSLLRILSSLYSGGGEAGGGETEVVCIFQRPGDCEPAAL